MHRLLLLVLALWPVISAAGRPNIVLILADDLGYGDLGCYGAKDIRTPHLDKMAAEGMRFGSFYAQPICGPSRAALMTGCYPMRLAEPGNVKNHMTLPHPQEILLSEIVKEVGYFTAQIGKWDLAGHHPGLMQRAELAPLQQAFDSQFGTPASNDLWQKTSLMRDGKVIEDPIDLSSGSTTRRYADEAIRVIRERKEKPFFIYLCPNMPHTALNVGKDFEGKSRRGLYGDVIEELDHHIGRILDTLRTEGIAENTLVVFTSDNGPWILQKEHGGSPGPLRGGKASTWEAGVRVPAIAWAPGRIAPGQTCDRIASTLDLLPTITTLTGGSMPQVALDGRDLSSWLLKGPPTGEDDGTYRYYLNTHLQAVRRGKWKLVLPRPQYPPWLTAGLRSTTRPHVRPEDNIEIKQPLLYDLLADPGEKTDVSAQHPEVVTALLAFAEQSRAQLGDYDRIGSEARFYYEGPKRPDMNEWKLASERKQTPEAAKRKANTQKQARIAPNSSVRSPNIVVILADDLGYGDLGCYGATKIKTPHLDTLAAEGLRLSSFYAQAVCGPSRAALMTGCYPIRIAEPGNQKNQHTVVHTKEVTMAEILHEAGYATGCIGKWHLGERAKDSPTGFDPATMPNGQGFDFFYGTPLYNGATVRVSDSKFRSTILRNEEVVVPAVESWDHITQDYTREALGFIREHRDKPFFLYLAHNMPHIPLGASEAFKGKSAGGPFGDAVEEIDWSCGEIVKTLRELGLAENTLVVFTSDNGPWIETTPGMKPEAKPFIPRDHSGNADPLRGYKMLTWEGGLRVPCIAWWPGKIPANSSSDAITSTIDFLPTFAALAGGKVPDDRVIDGRDLTALLQDPVKTASPHEAFYYYCFTHLQAVRSGKWKFVRKRTAHPPWVGWSGRFAGNAVDELSLHDLDNDIGETTNVAAQHPDVLARLRQLAHEARMDLGDYDHTGSGARFFDGPPPVRKAGAAKGKQR